MLKIILVQGFCPLTIKITQFPDGVRLNGLKRWLFVSLQENPQSSVTRKQFLTTS